MVEVRRPPIITQAMELLVSEPAVTARAVGSMPTIMVKVVIRIGLSLVLPASSTASFGFMPLVCMRVKV